MRAKERKSAIGMAIYSTIAVMCGLYFTFAAVQGDYGVFRRVQIEAEADALRQELNEISAEVSMLENKTHRLSDNYLDLDLLDQQARERLGYVRADEIVFE